MLFFHWLLKSPVSMPWGHIVLTLLQGYQTCTNPHQDTETCRCLILCRTNFRHTLSGEADCNKGFVSLWFHPDESTEQAGHWDKHFSIQALYS